MKNSKRVHSDHNANVPSTATIRIAGHFARLTPAVPEVVMLFEFEDTHFAPQNGRGGWLHRTVCLASSVDEGITFPAGALPRVLKHLADRGCSVTVEGGRSLSKAAAWLDSEFAAGLTGWQQQLAATIAIEPIGIIASSNDAQKFDQLGLVGRLCKRARVLVAVPTRADCEKYEIVLARYFGANVAWADNLGCDTPSRVAVCTFRQLVTTNPLHWHVLLLPELESVVAARVLEGWAAMQHHRLYGFLGSDRRWNRRTSLYVEAQAGQIIFEPNDRLTKPIVRVVFAEPRLTPTLYVPKSALDRKRQMIWENVERNRLVAELAQALAGGHQEALWARGLLLRESGNDSRGASPARTVVVVESLRHGRELLRLLPGWKLVGLEATAAGDAATGRVGPNSIVTVAALNRRELQHVDAVIRADAGDGVLDFSLLTPGGAFSTPGKVLLVDFADDCDARSASDARQRFVDYQRLNLEIAAPPWLSSPAISGHDVHRRRSR